VGSNSGDVIIRIAVPVLCSTDLHPIKTIGFNSIGIKIKYDQHNFRFCKTHQCFREMSLCKTSDSDVSSETRDWKMAFKREPINCCIQAKKVMRF
jgi:hypothetical protein